MTSLIKTFFVGFPEYEGCLISTGVKQENAFFFYFFKFISQYSLENMVDEIAIRSVIRSVLL